jgi:hypothetical protein
MRVTRIVVVLLLAVAFVAPAVHGQIAVPGAEKDTLSLLTTGGSVDFEFTQGKIGLSVLKELSCGGLAGADLEACKASPDRNHWDLTARLAVAAKDGKRTLFAGGELTPGFELSGAANHYWEKSGGGYTSLYFPLAAKFVEAPTATFTNGAAVLKDGTTKSLATGVGIVRAPSESKAFGISLGVQRNWGSPALQKTRQVCAVGRTGTDADGKVVTGAKCSDRYVEPLVDETVWQPRIEAVFHFPRGKGTSLGFVSSLSGSKRTGSHMAYNFVLGPTLHPAGKPQLVSIALLASLSDFTDANDRDLSFGDKFAVKAFVAIPLTGF